MSQHKCHFTCSEPDIFWEGDLCDPAYNDEELLQQCIYMYSGNKNDMFFSEGYGEQVYLDHAETHADHFDDISERYIKHSAKKTLLKIQQSSPSVMIIDNPK